MFSGKYLRGKTLRLMSGEISYTAFVSPEELWRRVGTLLEGARKRRGWSDWSDVFNNGGPTAKTVKRQEEGDVRKVDVLDQHARALGLTLVDVLRAALNDTSKPITPEAESLMRIYERLKSVQARRVLVSMAEVLEQEQDR